MRTGLMSVAGVVGAAVIAWSCAGILPHDDCLDYGTCTGLAPEGGPGGEAGRGGDGGVVIPATCDLTKSPKDSPSCVDDGVGIFVSPSGKGGATGKKADPLRSIAEAVAKAAADGKPRVYVCEGSYDAPFTIAQPVNIYGGFSCTWIANGAKPKLAPPKGIALTIRGVKGVVIEDVAVEGASDAAKSGDSAIAAFIADSDVTLRRVAVTAKDAQAAQPVGSTGNNWSGTAIAGNDPAGTTGGVEATCGKCADATFSKSGKGADATGPNQGVAAPGGAQPAVGTDNSGLSGGGSCTSGTVGAGGAAPKTGGKGATTPGTLTSQGWITTGGSTDGLAGKPGQGGGGGGARLASVGGGSGGCGGCGGGGGGPSQNGGSSFALLAPNSTVTIEASSLTAGAGGPGGAGGAGQDGQSGAAATAVTCNGGPGAAGGGGAGAGGGAGGHSAAVGFVGVEPRLDATSTVFSATKAAGGGGGAPGLGTGEGGTKGTSGAEGKTSASVAL